MMNARTDKTQCWRNRPEMAENNARIGFKVERHLSITIREVQAPLLHKIFVRIRFKSIILDLIK
jgi:hypothetical protein